MSLKPILTSKKPFTGLAFGSTLSITLLASVAASAQGKAIVPSPITPVAAIPAPPEAAAPLVTQPVDAKPRLDLQFVDIEISKLLQLISENFNVDIVVAQDVTGILRSIKLSSKTPEQAIQSVVQAAGLQYRKMDDGTYLVAKNWPGAAQAQGNDNVWGGGQTAANPFVANGNGGNWNNQQRGTLEGGFGGNDAPIAPRNGWNRNATQNGGIDTELPALAPVSGKEKKRTRYLSLRNVRPGIMAFWLDPANNDKPREFLKSEKMLAKVDNKTIAKPALDSESLAAMKGNSSTVILGDQFRGNTVNNPYVNRNSSSSTLSNSSLRPDVFADPQFQPGGGNQRRGGAGGAGGGVFNLPDGVDRIVAIDPQNALLVFGTDEGVRQLQDIIGKLDVPMRQVEIESQFVTVSTSDSRAFGIDYLSALGNFTASTNQLAPGTAAGSFSVGFIRGNFQATLNALVSTNRAKVITAPRVLAINNLTATLTSETATPIILTSSTSNIGGTVQGSQDLIYITTSIGLTVTPTINNDDTVTVYMVPEFSSQTPSGLANGAPVVSVQSVETIANVHDGETIALGGLKTKTVSVAGGKIPLVGDIPLIGKLFRSRTALNSESELIIFLTARIVRHLGDDVNLNVQ